MLDIIYFTIQYLLIKKRNSIRFKTFPILFIQRDLPEICRLQSNLTKWCHKETCDGRPLRRVKDDFTDRPKV